MKKICWGKTCSDFALNKYGLKRGKGSHQIKKIQLKTEDEVSRFEVRKCLGWNLQIKNPVVLYLRFFFYFSCSEWLRMHTYFSYYVVLFPEVASSGWWFTVRLLINWSRKCFADLAAFKFCAHLSFDISFCVTAQELIRQCGSKSLWLQFMGR